jgi:hypothetical protein
MGWMIYKLQKKLNLVEIKVNAVSGFNLSRMESERMELLGDHADLKNAVERVQIFSENLWGSLVEVGGYMADHETALSDERRGELEQKEAENHEIAMQDDSSDERLLSVQRSIMRMHRRFFEMSKLYTHLWMGLVRLGGFIGSNTITGEAHSDLVDRNNEIMEEWQRQGHSNLLGRRRHDTPPGGTPRIAAVEERTEGDESETMEHPDDFIDEDDTGYGAPPSETEPEPHGASDEPMETCMAEMEPDDEAEHGLISEQIELANRMETLHRELEQRMQDASLVGDELEANSLRLQLANVENLQYGLPRPTI